MTGIKRESLSLTWKCQVHDAVKRLPGPDRPGETTQTTHLDDRTIPTYTWCFRVLLARVHSHCLAVVAKPNSSPSGLTSDDSQTRYEPLLRSHSSTLVCSNDYVAFRVPAEVNLKQVVRETGMRSKASAGVSISKTRDGTWASTQGLHLQPGHMDITT